MAFKLADKSTLPAAAAALGASWAGSFFAQSQTPAGAAFANAASQVVQGSIGGLTAAAVVGVGVWAFDPKHKGFGWQLAMFGGAGALLLGSFKTEMDRAAGVAVLPPVPAGTPTV